jgi:hypothetical protein
MFESKKMIPSEMVLRGLERLSEWCRSQQDLNAVRQQLIASIERLGSWEDSFEQNVEATHGVTPLSLPDCSHSSETTNQA